MLTITIDRASIGASPLTITDNGSGVFTLMPGFSIGGVTPRNVYAESRWQDGAVLTSTSRDLSSIDMTLRINGGSLAGVAFSTNDLSAALGQFSYTVTVNESGVISTYECMPATWRRLFDRDEMRSGRDLVVVSIPRQP